MFADLNRYAAIMHFLGQSTILSPTPEKGTGEAAQHLRVDDGKKSLMVAALTLSRDVREAGRRLVVFGAIIIW